MTFDKIISTLPQHIQNKLNDLMKMKERPDFHPEENCFEHVRIVTNRCIQFGDKDLICTGIFHDIHKLDTVQINPKTGHPTSPGHDKWAFKTVMNDQSVRQWIVDFGADPDTVAGLCGQHMRIHQIGQMKPAKQTAIMNLSFFDKLAVFSVFDNMLISDDQAQQNAKVILDDIKHVGDILPNSLLGKFSDKNRG